MKQSYPVRKFLTLLIVLMFASCGGEAVPPMDTAEVVGLIQQDAKAVADNPNVTNGMALLDIEGYKETNVAQENVFVEPSIVEEEVPNIEPLTTTIVQEKPMMDRVYIPKKAKRKRVAAPMKAVGSSITVGNDGRGQIVSVRKTQKITTVVRAPGVKFSDILIYAIPVGSDRPIRNYNTLIGFAKNFDVVSGQVQFTRYWNAKTTQGVPLKRGMYYVYFTYTHKDRRGRVLSSGGRYWGGNSPIAIRVE